MTAIKTLPAEFYTNFLSNEAKERPPNSIRSLFPLEYTPGLISLLAGKPNAATFPFTSFRFSSRSPHNNQEVEHQISGSDLAIGLQYGDTAGLKDLLNWTYGLQELMHGRKREEGWKISVGSGSQDLLYKAIASMIDPGDSVLVESPVYAGVLPIFESLHCDLIEVQTDAYGISSSSLRSILENWPSEKTKPRVLYTVPYGCNPTGMSATLERRKEVLELAHQHDFIIMEDDPYFYVYYGVASRAPSYFSLESAAPCAGRVLRFDSLSKILSAGIRIGFVTGPEPLLVAIDRHTATSNLQTSTLTQVITYTLLNSWGYDGFKKHTDKVSQFYRDKRDVFERAMKKHLSGLAEWNKPEAGMFYWFKLILPDELANDSDSVIRTKALNHGVLALPGSVFLPNGAKTAYVRAAFSLASEEEVDIAVKRLRDAILETQSTTTVKQ